MRQNIYLHSHIVNTLRMFGDIDAVINKIVDWAIDTDAFSNLTKIPDRKGAARYLVNIVNEDYNNMVEAKGVTNPYVSVRRLVYYFVENEVYSELGWEIDKDYAKKQQDKIVNSLYSCIQTLNILLKTSYNDNIYTAKEILEKELKDYE